MPIGTEVPDSDDDSDIEEDLPETHKLRETHCDTPATQDSPDVPIVGLDVNFDDFLRRSRSDSIQTSQDRMQSLTSLQPEAAIRPRDSDGKSTGSTGRLLKEVERKQNRLLEDGSSVAKTAKDITSPRSSDSPNAAKLKRRSATTLGPESSSLVETRHLRDNEGSHRKRARTETYSKKNRVIDQAARGFEVLRENENGNSNVESSAKDCTEAVQGGGSDNCVVKPFINPTDMHLDPLIPIHPTVVTSPPKPDEESLPYENNQPRKRGRPRRVVSLLDDAVSTVTSQSTIGGYQTYNIDMRSRSRSSNADINPFFDNSSHEPFSNEETNEIRPPDGFNHSDQEDSTADPVTNLGEDGNALGVASKQRPVSEASPSIALRMSSKRKSSHQVPDEVEDDSDREGGGIVSEESHHQQRKSRKRRDTTSSLSSEPQLSGPENQEYESAAARESDQDYINIQKSNIGRKKRGRKPKPKDSVRSSQDDGSPDASSQVDDLEIGLPKERYKPRPSRSRGDINEFNAEKQPNTLQDSSPAKNVSSEAALSDEIMIGLPKEQYKPRPSRSRSKRTKDVEDVDPKKPNDESSQQSQKDSADMPPPPPKISKKEQKPSKMKVKRAKTSGGFAAKSQMVDDEDKDVIWMDEKPVAVKLELPKADLSPIKVKQEKHGNGENSLEPEEKSGTAQNNEETVNTSAQQRHLAVEIPAPDPDGPPPATQGPKKRGRKRKKTDEIAPGPIDNQGVDQDQQEIEGTQIVPEDAKETDAAKPSKRSNKKNNVPSSISSTTSRQPLTEKSANLLHHNQNTPTGTFTSTNEPATDNLGSSQENVSEAPLPPPPETPTEHSGGDRAETETEIGPTKHSPIRACGGSWDSKKYRVGLSRKQRIPSLLRTVRK